MYNAHFNLITIWPSKRSLNEQVSFQLNNVRIKTQQSEDRELQILTKYVLSFIIISPSTLSWLQHLRKIDDTRCCLPFHTFRVLGSVSNMGLLNSTSLQFSWHAFVTIETYRVFSSCFSTCCAMGHLAFGPLTYVIKDAFNEQQYILVITNI